MIYSTQKEGEANLFHVGFQTKAIWLKLRSLRADAESRAVRWDEQGAIDRLRAAQALSKALAKDGKLDRAGNMEASIIDSRLRALEAVRRELLRPQN